MSGLPNAKSKWTGVVLLAVMATMALPAGWSKPKEKAGKAGSSEPACRLGVMSGELEAGQEWHAGIGEGWVFRVVPIAPVKGHDYTGWDLVVDRMDDGGYPDALLLATPPYGSLNEREIGTTFGLRAQDAIGWNPRHFHFLTSEKDLARGRRLFSELGDGRRAQSNEAMRGLLELTKAASAGEFRVLNAKLSSGSADAADYARQWALRSRETPHTVEQDAGTLGSGLSNPTGKLKWMRFSVKLWLPLGWETPRGVVVTEAKCAQ